MRTLVLASTSPYRKKLLGQLQIPFLVAKPRCREVVDPRVAPELTVKHLALEKAASLRSAYPDALIIGADQLFVDHRHRPVGKPGTSEEAVRQLTAMAGRTSTFYTGLAVLDAASGESVTDFSTFSVTLKSLSGAQIRSYVRRENPVDCAGSFKIEGLGIALMERLEGEDFNALIGLPLIKLACTLERFGVELL